MRRRGRSSVESVGLRRLCTGGVTEPGRRGGLTALSGAANVAPVTASRSKSSRRAPRAEDDPTPDEVSRPPAAPAQQLLAMQRAAGNQAVAGLLQRGVSSMFRNNPSPVRTQAALNQKVQDFWRQYGPMDAGMFPDYERIKPDLTDAAITRHTQGFLTDATPRTVKEVARDVYALIRESSFGRRLVNEGSGVLSGVRAAVLSAEAETSGLSRSTPLPSAAVDLHAPSISFRAVVGVDGSPAALQGWQVGITQTVLHVDRRFSMRLEAMGDRRIVNSTTTLAAPANDRNEGSAAPWYNTHSAVDGGSTIHTVTLHDMPGEDFTSSAAQITGVTRAGSDRFGTWVILWHPATQRVRFLGGWTWTVDYDDEAGTRTRVSGFASRVGTGADPPEAVIGGARCKDVLTSTKSPPLPITTQESAKFDDAAASERNRKAFTDAATAFTKALAGTDTALLTAERDRLLTAWRALDAARRPQREAELLGKLSDYEQKVNHRIPSQDALRAQYDVRS